ncbi:hypothetical protein DV738_g1229, partial [Chaetothyriales sp. CBS 135597]
MAITFLPCDAVQYNDVALLRSRAFHMPASSHYKSPTGEKDLVLPIQTTCSAQPHVEEQVAFLSELRANTKTLQAEINSFLTEKMAEDKARDGADIGANSRQGTKAQEDLEEENYGEEAEDQDG